MDASKNAGIADPTDTQISQSSPTSGSEAAAGDASIPTSDLPTQTQSSLKQSEPPHSILIKWAGKEITIEDIRGLKTVIDLKRIIQQKTGVQTDRQKLLNLSFKGKQAHDDCPLANLNLKVGHKIMMMGSLEKDIENVDIPPEEQPDVHNDLDTPEDEDDTIENNEIHLNKIARRVDEYEVKIFNPSRPGKKLLVLDIDYTLFDHLSTAETGTELMRPFLHEFLTSAYNDYDIVIWSASNMKWIEAKMTLLGVDTNPNYKIAFYLDYLAMITVNLQKKGVKKVKPLGVIWGKFPQYSPKNTIMIDDVRRNFIMNPQSGLVIRPFRSAHVNRATDRELVHIGKYLRKIARLDDFSDLNHRKWEKYRRKGSKKRRRHGSPSHASGSGGGNL